MKLARARVEDLADIVRLEEAFPARERWSEASWSSELEGGDRTVLVARDAQALLGVVAFARAGDVTDLYRIVVAPHARRRGVAEALARAGLGQVGGRVLLEVRDDNAPAIALYHKLGFATISTRRDYYAAGVDALIMERPAPTTHERKHHA